MKYYSDLEEYQDAMSHVDFSKDLNVKKTGGFLMEGLELECYNKCQSILNCPEMSKAHKYCLDIDFDNLRQDIMDKVNQLYQLATDRGFIQNGQEPCQDADDEFFADQSDDYGFQGQTTDIGDGSQMYDQDQEFYGRNDDVEQNIPDTTQQIQTEPITPPQTTSQTTAPELPTTTQEIDTTDAGDDSGDVEDDVVENPVDDTEEDSEEDDGDESEDDEKLDENSDAENTQVVPQETSQTPPENPEESGDEGVEGDSENEEVSEPEDGELDDDTKKIRKDEYTSLFRNILNSMYETTSKDEDVEDGEVPEGKSVAMMNPQEKAEFWKKVAEGWEGKDDLSLFMTPEELTSLEDEMPDPNAEEESPEGNSDDTEDVSDEDPEASTDSAPENATDGEGEESAGDTSTEEQPEAEEGEDGDESEDGEGTEEENPEETTEG